jgi:putative ABC transport system permease protein
VALFGYQLAPHGVPAPPSQAGKVYADTSLKAHGVKEGQTLLLGPKRYPVSVVGWVSGTNFLLQGGLWGNVDTWREVLASARPDLMLAAGTYQVLTVSTAAGADPARVAAAIDVATGGTTYTVTGIKQQRSTFNAIIDMTFVVAALVVALFFVLLILERTGMYAVFKAIGASSGQLVSQVVLQAIVIAALSFVLGAMLALAVGAVIPPEVPLELTVGRAIEVALGLIVMATLGSGLSLRRVVRIDPATAIS